MSTPSEAGGTTGGGWPEALGRVPSGLFILTARHGELETGMLASWVMQAGFEPPSVTIAVRHERYLAEWLSAEAPAVLNLIAADNKTLLKHFGRGFEPGQNAFDGRPISRCPRGVAILNEALGHLELQPRGKLEAGDHTIFLAEIVGGHLASQAAPAVHVRNSGLRY